jgi:hypothetical protein
MMVKIIEIHHSKDNKNNFQSRIIEDESFENYVSDLRNNGNYKFHYASIPRRCKLENLTIGDKWLECEFKSPFGESVKHIAWELTLNEDKSIKFENGSEVEIMESKDNIRGFSREYACYFVGSSED